VADALSRTSHAPAHEISAMSTVTSPWVQTLQEAYAQDPETTKLFKSSQYTLLLVTIL